MQYFFVTYGRFTPYIWWRDFSPERVTSKILTVMTKIKNKSKAQSIVECARLVNPHLM